MKCRKVDMEPKRRGPYLELDERMQNALLMLTPDIEIVLDHILVADKDYVKNRGKYHTRILSMARRLGVQVHIQWITAEDDRYESPMIWTSQRKRLLVTDLFG